MPTPNLFWPTTLMPNLLTIRQSHSLSNFGQYKLFTDYIFHVLNTVNAKDQNLQFFLLA